jgi:hypothetical protein
MQLFLITYYYTEFKQTKGKLIMKKLITLTLMFLLSACGGGGSDIITDTKYIDTIKLYNGSVPFNISGTDNNGSKGYVDVGLDNVNIETIKVSTKITFIDFFKENPVGHFAMALKADNNTTTSAQGQGVAIGALWGTPQGSSYPFSAHIENWQLGTNEVLRVTQYPVQDNKEYHLEVYATDKDTKYTLSYQGVLLHDTGYIKNNMVNVGTKSNVIFAFVFGNPDNYDWSIVLKDTYITWETTMTGLNK